MSARAIEPKQTMDETASAMTTARRIMKYGMIVLLFFFVFHDRGCDTCDATGVGVLRSRVTRTKPALRRQQGKSGSGRSRGGRGGQARQLSNVLGGRWRLDRSRHRAGTNDS